MAKGMLNLEVVNDSLDTWDFVLYRVYSDPPDPNTQSLVWLIHKGLLVNSLASFNWSATDNPSFVWAETGPLKPGVIFEAAETLPAGWSKGNKVNFNRNDDYYHFEGQTNGEHGDKLYITQSKDIQHQEASVGLGIEGYAALVVQAQPMVTAHFTPSPQCWIAFGHFTEGEVLDLDEISEQSRRIVFPPNVYSIKAVLEKNNTWKIENKDLPED